MRNRRFDNMHLFARLACAVTASGRHRLRKIKACIDYGAEWFGKAR